MLLGEAPPELPPLVASEVESETVWLVAMEQSKYWKNINIKACEPKEGLYSFVYEYFLLKLTSIFQTLKSSHSLFLVRSARTFYTSPTKSLGRTSQSTQARLHVPEI
jgi:hypothetical protein